MFAANYSGSMTVNVNGTSTVQDGVTITITETNGVYDMVVANLTLGELRLNGIAGTADGATSAFYADAMATIGSQATPLKGLVRFTAKYLAADLELTVDGQPVKLTFDNSGKAFQLPNGDFEQWHAASGEPDHWHGFKSATGKFASTSNKIVLTKSTDIRPGATGSCAEIQSTFIIVTDANGTITNGRLAANSMTASNTGNHSEMDKNSTDTDNNGDKFYMEYPAKADAIKTWIYFKQGVANKEFPYATLSAVVFDGNYYQDPENKTYTNVAAKAQNKTIEVTDWKELVVPFDYNTYAKNNAAPNAILVTVSTNATPGKGSGKNAVDVLRLDDMELVYLAGINSVTYKGNAIAGETIQLGEGEVPVAADFVVDKQGVGSLAGINVVEKDGNYVAYIYVTSADLKTTQVCTVNMIVPKQTATGDVNADGKIDIIDLNILINIMLGQDKADKYNGRADLNGDGVVDIVDVNNVINLILHS